MQNDTSFGQTHDALGLLEQRAYQTDQELSGVSSETSYITSLQVLAEADQSGTITLKLSSDAPYDINSFTRHWQQLAGLPEGTRSLSVQNTRRMVDALRIELRATDDSILTTAGEKLKEELQKIPSVSGIKDNLQPGQPQLQLKLTEQGRALGMTTEMLSEQIYQGFSGQVVQRYQRNSDEIEVKVRYPEDERQNSADLLKSSVRTSDGTVLPLSSVAAVTYGYTRDTITRIDGKRAVYISADVDKDAVSATELVSTLKTTVAAELQANYPGLSIHFAGEAEQQAETQNSMVQVFCIAMLMIYMLLAIPLKSYVQPLLIMTAIPFGIVGAILGHWINDLSLGIFSLNGIIALSGVVVNDSLLLVSRFNTLRAEGLGLHDAISGACRNRLRAVLLTSFTTFGGLMPLLSETSLAGPISYSGGCISGLRHYVCDVYYSGTDTVPVDDTGGCGKGFGGSQTLVFSRKRATTDMLNVLLVEDDLDLADTVVQYLELEGIRCDHGANGMAGLQLAKEGGYQVLLLDINLPRLDGFSLCEQLRDAGDDTPILMLTARDGLEDKLAGFKAGTDDYLVKPFALQELVVRLEALSRRRSGQATQIILCGS